MADQLNRCGPKIVFVDQKRLATAHAAAANVAALHKPLVIRLVSRSVDEESSLPKGVVELKTVLAHEPRFVAPSTPIDAAKDV